MTNPPPSGGGDDVVVSGVGVGVRAKDILAKLKPEEDTRKDGQVTYPAIPHDLPAISPTSKLALAPSTATGPSPAAIERRRRRQQMIQEEVIQPGVTDYEVRHFSLFFANIFVLM